MSSRAPFWIAATLLVSSGAQAAVVEVPEEKANQIAPLPADFWVKYRHATALETAQLFDPIVIGGTVIALDVLVNLGKSVWKLIEKGSPQVDAALDNTASAVPQGITHWTQLQQWQDPVSKLYSADLLNSRKEVLETLYFRLVFSYGGNVNGRGQYLSGVTLMPAEISATYLRTVFADSKVIEIDNQGTEDDPVAAMTLNLEWGRHSLLPGLFGSPTLQSAVLQIRGDGQVSISSTD